MAKLLGVLLVAFACAAGAALPTPATAPSTGATTAAVKAKTYSGDGWAIAAPAAWQSFAAAVKPPMVLDLIGDGKGGMPLKDGTLKPIQLGITVELFPPGPSLQERVDRDIAKLKGDARFKLHGDPITEKIRLADGVIAILFQAEFERLDKGRLSLYQRVYAADPTGRHISATGFIACGIGGGRFVRDTSIHDFLQAHLRTLVLDPAKVDPNSLRSAYASFNFSADDAVTATSQGNQLIARQKFADAIGVFKAAIDDCDSIAAAHNGLSWSLLQLKQQEKLPEALAQAEKAVTLTDRRDIASLDTLAVAYDRAGKKNEAIETIKEALKLEPENAELKARLTELEFSGK